MRKSQGGPLVVLLSAILKARRVILAPLINFSLTPPSLSRVAVGVRLVGLNFVERKAVDIYVVQVSII